MVLASTWRARALVALASPGMLWIAYPKGSSKTQTDLTRDAGWDAVRDEDYAAQQQVQRALPSVAGECQVFGRNEPAVQHFHRTLARLIDGER